MSRRLRPVLAAAVVALSLAPAAGADGPFRFHSLTPCRIVDTRNAVGPTGGPALQSSTPRNFPVQGQCGVPVGAKAAALNVTIAGPTGAGHLSMFPSGGSVPLVSTLNFNAGEPALANGAIVPLSTNAQDLGVSAFVLGGGSVHLIIDVTGYFQ
jgi:hypothetical protein